MCNVYRRFTKDFAKVAKPLNALSSSTLPKDLEPPTKEQQAAFDKLRELLLNPPVLAIPKLDGHYIVDVDASYDQLGCCLLQQQTSVEYLPVGYFSKTLEPAQRNYGVTEIEGLGVVWAVTLLRPYLEGSKFLVRCDHRALQWIFTTQCTNNRLNRWRLRLAEFDFDIEYKQGRKHTMADGLSRLLTDGLDTAPISEEIPVVGVVTRSGRALEPSRPENKEYQPIPLAEVVAAQAEDTFCQTQRKRLETLEDTRFFVSDDGVLLRHGHQQGVEQLVIPDALKSRVLKREHDSPMAGHPGPTKLYQTLRRHYYWPSMAADVYGWVAACATCAKNSLMINRQTHPMRLFPAREPFAAIAMDLLGPLPKTQTGHEYLLVMCDRFTKLTRAVPLKDTTAMDVVSAFLDHWVAAYGIPDSTLTDNGPQFASVLFQGVLSLLGIVANFATPYHPQTNGQVERFNHTIIRQLRHYVSDHVKTWDQYASVLTTAYNSQVHATTGEVPFSFVCPRRLPAIAVEHLSRPDETPGEELTPAHAKAKFMANLADQIPRVQEAMDKAQARYKRHFDRQVKKSKSPPKQGDWVFVHSHAKTGSKLLFKTLGPYQVLRTDGHRYTIESDDGIRTVSGNHIARAPAPAEDDPAWDRAREAWALPELPSSKDIHEPIFEKFVSHGWDDDDGRLMLRVRWFGYTSKDDTWIHVEDLPRDKVRQYCQRKKMDTRPRSGSQ